MLILFYIINDTLALEGLIIIDKNQYTIWNNYGIKLLKKKNKNNYTYYNTESINILSELNNNGNKTIDVIFINSWFNEKNNIVILYYINNILLVGGIIIIDSIIQYKLIKLINYLFINSNTYIKSEDLLTFYIIKKITNTSNIDWNLEKYCSYLNKKDQKINENKVFKNIKKRSSINAKGYWEGLEAKEQHAYDNILSKSLLNFFKEEKVKRVADFGCGMGDYVKYLNKNGIKADGYDGNPNTPVLTNGFGSILDLSIPHTFKEKYEWVYTFEVGEHLPKEYEEIFINNLHKNNKYGIILSWAIKGQGGHGHVNEQNNDYIKLKIMKLGYTNDIIAENIMRKNSKLWWFKKTIMVFRKVNI